MLIQIQKNTYMTKLIDNIIFNEVSKIHYNIPKKIGIKVNTDTIDTYNYEVTYLYHIIKEINL